MKQMRRQRIGLRRQSLGEGALRVVVSPVAIGQRCCVNVKDTRGMVRHVQVVTTRWRECGNVVACEAVLFELFLQ